MCYSLFSNLLKNAVEASPEGEQVIIEAAPGFQSIHVMIDNASEVPVAMQGCFFEKYTTHGKEGGTGLGTYLARLMAERQGGGVVMGSSGGRTRLTVTLRQA
jgi:two-component system sensor histidine kinase/response regulator